jgi:hypothetical protein
MLRILIVSLIAAFLSTAAFAQNKSVYTSLAADKCKTASVDQGMPGNYSGKCPGIAGFALEAYLDDERNSVGVVLPNKKVIGLDLWKHFANFSELGETAEWRMKGKRPVALIIRLKVMDQGDDKPGTSYLIVSKLSATAACVTDIVKPGKRQNLTAQRLADKALTRPCKTTDNN